MPLPPGIGNPQQALQATAFMRQQPWYQALVRSWGVNPAGDQNGNVRLSDAQQQQLLAAARQHGIGISDRYQIDENGQIAEQPSHLWRNIGIGAGIGGLTLTGLGAAGIGPLSGLFGAGTGAGAAAAESGVLPSTVIGSGYIPAIVGGTGATGLSTGLGTGLATGAGSAGATVANYLKVGAPVAAAITNRLGQPSSGGNGVNSLDPALLSRLSQLLDLAQQRTQASQPVYTAAMNMASRMAPTYGDSPRLTEAINTSTTPAPSGPNYGPGTLAALQRIAAGGR